MQIKTTVCIFLLSYLRQWPTAPALAASCHIRQGAQAHGVRDKGREVSRLQGRVTDHFFTTMVLFQRWVVLPRGWSPCPGVAGSRRCVQPPLTIQTRTRPDLWRLRRHRFNCKWNQCTITTQHQLHAEKHTVQEIRKSCKFKNWFDLSKKFEENWEIVET